MAELQDIIAYLLAKYPHKSELSNARVTKMIYLADWRSAITRSCQISSISWHFDNYGPFVWDVKDAVEKHPSLFKIEDSQNMFGERKCQFALADTSYVPNLKQDEQVILDHVIQSTKSLHWNSFINLVYSTYPVLSSDRFTSLDLVTKASEYRQQANT